MSSLAKLKDEYIAKVEEHSGLRQDALRERVSKIKTLKGLANMCNKEANHWFGEGEYWDHYFYIQWGAIAKSIADQATDSPKPSKSSGENKASQKASQQRG